VGCESRWERDFALLLRPRLLSSFDWTALRQKYSFCGILLRRIEPRGEFEHTKTRGCIQGFEKPLGIYELMGHQVRMAESRSLPRCRRSALPRSRGAAFSLVELLVVLAILGIAIGLLLPAIAAARESARRAQCQSHQRQVGLAILNFESAHRVFPASGWTRSGPGNPYGTFMGWRTVILPQLEQSNVRTLYDIQQNWWEGTNLAVASIPIPIYLCPSTPAQPPVLNAVAKSPRPALIFSLPLARSDYEAIQGVQPRSIDAAFYDESNRFSVMHRNSVNRFGSILDGASNTVMVVESSGRPSVYRRGRFLSSLSNDQGIGWIDSESAFSLDGASADGAREGCGPAGGCTTAINARNDNEPYSFHPGGMHALFCDGHVSFLSESISLRVMAALSTRAAADDSHGWESD